MYSRSDFFFCAKRGSRDLSHLGEFVDVSPESDFFIGLSDTSDWCVHAEDSQNIAILTGPDREHWTCAGSPSLQLRTLDIAGVVVVDGSPFIIRDPFGRLPIVGQFEGPAFWATSALNIVSGRPNTELLRAYLGFDERSDDDFFLNRSRLLPAHYWNPTTGMCRYWTPESQLSLEYDEVATRVRGILASYCSPNSCVLTSGGLDSAFLASLTPNATICTMSAPDVAGMDETDWSLRLASELGAVHHLIDITDVAQEGLGFLAPAPICCPQFHPNENAERAFLARSSVATGKTRFLTGVGADELFTMPVALVWDSLVQRRQFAYAMMKRNKTRPAVSAVWRLIRGQANDLDSIETHRKDISLSWAWEHVVRQLRRHEQILNIALITPFMDRKLWNTVCAIDPELLFRGGAKGLLRQAAKADLSDTVRNRPKDTTFSPMVHAGLFESGLDITGWFVNRQSVLSRSNLIETEAFERRLQRYIRGERDELSAIWRVLSAEKWLRIMEENFENELEQLDEEQYEAPMLIQLGELGEVIRGSGSQQYDWGNGCTSTGPDTSDFNC